MQFKTLVVSFGVFTNKLTGIIGKNQGKSELRIKFNSYVL